MGKSEIQEPEISLKDVIATLKKWMQYLLSKWLIILMIGIIGGGIGFVYAFTQEPEYTATLTYALEDEKGGGGGMSGALGLASSLGFDLGSNAGGAFGSANLMELMHSRSLIEKTLLSKVVVNGKIITLAEYFIVIKKMKYDWQNSFKNVLLKDNKRDKFTREQDSVLGVISSIIQKDHLTIVQKDKKIMIGTIEVKSKEELFSKYFCESLIKEVTAFYVDTKSKRAKMNVDILERQADSIRAELNSAITGVAAANDNTFNLNPSLNVRRAPSARRQVDVQANTAILTQLVANLEMAKVSLRKETPLVQVIDYPILPLRKEKISTLKTMIFGGIIAGLLMLSFLVCQKLYKDSLSEY